MSAPCGRAPSCFECPLPDCKWNGPKPKPTKAQRLARRKKKARAYAKKYYRENRDKVRAYQRQYYQDNRERIKKEKLDYYHRKKQEVSNGKKRT